MSDKFHIGDVVVFHGHTNRQRNALITAVWSQHYVNLVFVSDDENEI